MEEWRLIEDPPLDGAENMAADEAMLRFADEASLRGDRFVPTLRLYSWAEPAVSIGYRQGAGFVETCGVDIPLVRRVTGGRAVLHFEEITYAIVLPRTHPLYSAGINSSYEAVSRAVVAALENLGVEAELSRKRGERGSERSEACFLAPSRSEVLVNGKKLVGSAQRRLKGALLQHGSILIDVDRPLTESLFGGGVVERMAWVRDFSDITEGELRASILSHIGSALGARFSSGTLTGEELEIKERLMGEYGEAGVTDGGTDSVKTRPASIAL